MKPTAQAITEQVCRLSHVELADLLGDSRHPVLVKTRRVIVGLIREWTYLSYPEIARHFGRLTHSAYQHQHEAWLAMPERDRDGWRFRVSKALEYTPPADGNLSGELAELARRELGAQQEAA